MPLTTVQLGMQGTPQFYGFKNRIINGGMVLDQRNAGASVTITDTGAITYTVDRWGAYGSVASRFSVQQNAGSVTPPVGFTNYAGITSLSSYSVTSGDIFQFAQFIEGFNSADLGWGTANAKTVTLSFWVRSSLTGTFGGSFVNSAVDRSYPFTYTISNANTWEYKTITVAGDTSGTWVGSTNGVGIRVYFGLGAGSTNSGTAGAWASGLFRSATGATSVVGTSGATFYITGVQFEVGVTATSFDFRSYGQELFLCQRYFEIVNAMSSGYTGGGNNAANTANFIVPKRAAPTMTWTGGIANINYSQTSPPGIYQSATIRNWYPFRTATGTGQDSRWEDGYTASAEL